MVCEDRGGVKELSSHARDSSLTPPRPSQDLVAMSLSLSPAFEAVSPPADPGPQISIRQIYPGF
jgi:hypothetical protein